MPEMTMREAAAQTNPLLLSDDGYATWLGAHRDHRGHPVSIGGGDVGAILGLNRYRTAADVWDRLLEQAAPTAENANMRRGTVMEPVICQLYAEESGRRVWESRTMYHRTLAWHRVNVDRMIGACAGHEGAGVLETKSQNERVFRATKQLGIDPSYYAQLQWGMHVTGKSWGSFAALWMDGWELHWFDVERDDAFLATTMARVEQFWVEHVLARRRPEGAMTSGDPLPVPTRVQLGATEVQREDDAWVRAVALLRIAKTEKDIAERSWELAKERVQALMREADAEVVNSAGARISWKESTSRSLNKELLVAAAPLDRVKVQETFEQLAEEVREWSPSAAEAVTAAERHLLERGVLDLATVQKVSVSRSFVPTFR